MRPGSKTIYFAIVTILLLLAAGGAACVLWLNYDQLIAAVIKTINKNGLEEKIRNEIFTRPRFALLQQLARLTFLLVPLCFYLALRGRIFIMSCVSFLTLSVVQAAAATRRIFKQNSRWQNQSLLALMLVIVLFFTCRMITAYVTYDEAWNFNYYTDHPFYYSFFTYSNYPLFETTTHFFKWLPFPMKINLRLPAFIAGTASCLLLYACLRRYFGSHLIAMAGLAAFAFTPLTVVFMVTAKGVMFELFFSIAGIFSLAFWLGHPGRKQWLVIYGLSAVGGLLSMPTHFLFLLFMLLIVQMLLFKKNRPAAVVFLKANLLVLAASLLLYAPLMLTSGISVVENLPTQLSDYSNVLKGLPLFMYVMLGGYAGYGTINIVLFSAALITIVWLHKKIKGKSRFILLLAVGLPLSTICFYLLTGLQYPGRSLAFGSLSISLLVSLFTQLAQPWFDENEQRKKIAGYFFTGLALLLTGYVYLPAHKDDKNVAEVARLFIKYNVRSCYDNSSADNGFFYYYPGIEYQYRLQHTTIAFTLSAKNSMRYKPLLSPTQYDCIVYDASLPPGNRAVGFHELYRDTNGKFIIWLRNGIQ